MLVRQTWGTHYIDFLYDESGSPYSLIYDGVQYYYVKNLQGDVVQIRSSYGTLLVEYTYDAWGNVLSITGSNASVLGANNPIRYRSYYYDFETGFYYLQSRYYDPAIRRFINADGYASTGQGFIGYNMYAYCLNNPVMYADYTGEDATSALQTWTVTMWWLTAADGPIPVGDIVYGVVILVLGTLTLTSTNTTTTSIPLEKIEIKQKVKAEEREKEIAISEVSNAIYYGCTIGPSGDLMYLTGPMGFSVAHSWAMNFITTTRNNWGLYTQNAKDAIIMASALSTYAEPLYHYSHDIGYYEHYHTNPHNFTNKIKTYKKFHVWFGYPSY